MTAPTGADLRASTGADDTTTPITTDTTITTNTTTTTDTRPAPALQGRR